MANIARLGVILGLSSTEFVQGIDRAKQKTKELEADFVKLRAGIAIVGTAFVATTMKVLQFADQMSDAADAYQVSVRGILDISKALEKAGGSFDNAGRLLGQFSNKVDEAASGSKQAQEAFARIGISLKDLETLSTEDLLSKTASSLAQIEDPLTRNAIAFDVFGRAMRGVDITRFASELNNGAQATDKQVAAVQQLAAYMEKLEGIITQVKLTLSEALLPILKFAEIQMKDFGGTAEIVGKVIKAAFDGVVATITFVVESIKWAVASLANLNTAAASLMTGGSFWDTLKNLGSENNERFLQNLKEVQNALKGGSPTESSNGFAGRKVTPYEDKSADTKLANLLKQLETLRFISIQFDNQQRMQVEGINVQTQMLYLTQNQAQVYQAMYQLDKQRSAEVAKLEEKRKEAVAAGADNRVIEQIDQEIEKVNELAEAYKTKITDAITQNQTLSQSFEGGLLASYQKFQFESINVAETVSSSVDALFSGMTNALTAFVMTGKLNFADFTRAIIADLIRIQMQLMVSKLFSMAIGAIVSPMITPGTSPFIAGPPAPRAEGGDVFSDTPYIVGERGPEMFVPQRNGTIIPNNKLGDMGGTTYVTNNYIDAIDTKSFEDRLYGSSRAVWAANQYATKNISNSRTRS
jgi:hypothetical protein